MLVPEVDQFAPAARVGFQVHFTEREPDMMAVGGRLLADAGPAADAMVIDVTVMDGDWRQEVRAEVLKRVLAAMADACDPAEPSPAWWVTFRVIDEGSWARAAPCCPSSPSSTAACSPRRRPRPSAPRSAREKHAAGAPRSPRGAPAALFDHGTSRKELAG
ncbi:hypothetical protein AB0P05_20655 [Streptomyces flaveolus]|uniref:hypothetical protein n=1 Tax=Streptomyces flaveolus TaxID=67297 RepID=UPI00342DB593